MAAAAGCRGADDSLQAPASGAAVRGQEHAAELLAALDVRVCIGSFGQLVRAVDHHLQSAVGDLADEALDILGRTYALGRRG